MEIIQDKILMSTPWVILKERSYKKNSGKAGAWSYIERHNHQQAVIIITRTSQSNSLILIRQFRIPLGRYIIEFPAGLIDEGESVKNAAYRELLEETGYQGESFSVSPPLCVSPGLTNETVYMAHVKVAEEPVQKAQPDDSEDIEVIVLKPQDIPSFLQKCHHEETMLDARTHIFLEIMSQKTVKES